MNVKEAREITQKNQTQLSELKIMCIDLLIKSCCDNGEHTLHYSEHNYIIAYNIQQYYKEKGFVVSISNLYETWDCNRKRNHNQIITISWR
jgi:hypothetical protein